MNESDEIKDWAKAYKKAVEEKKALIKQAVKDTRLIRQVQTEQPNR